MQGLCRDLGTVSRASGVLDGAAPEALVLIDHSRDDNSAGEPPPAGFLPRSTGAFW
jgi:hypothetical protein